MSPSVIEGTWEEIERHKAELVGRRLRATIRPEKVQGAGRQTKAIPKQRLSALGKHAFVSGSSEEFAQEKQAEIKRENGWLVQILCPPLRRHIAVSPCWPQQSPVPKSRWLRRAGLRHPGFAVSGN